MSGVAYRLGDDVQVRFFDGKRAVGVLAMLARDGDTVTIRTDEGLTLSYARRDVKVLSQLEDAPRRIEFSDGAAATCEFSDAVTALFPDAQSATLAHRLERNLSVVFVSLAGVIAALVWAYFYAIPWLAKEVAERMPASIEQQLGSVALTSLDRALFGPTGLGAEAQAPIRASFGELSRAANLPHVTLQFRDGGKIGANALALPGGIVVVTDQLVAAMPSTKEVTAVLAHELGHVAERHSLRHAIQGSALGILSFMLLGDISAISATVATAPAALAQAGYSRDAEREADAYAFALLAKVGLSPATFATAISALRQAHEAGNRSGGGKSGDRMRIPEYLSTHPDTDERARAAQAAAGAIRTTTEPNPAR